ncbi:class I SAM-dependent methyltransferase [Brevibacillus centrosporus]|jgi:ubiquinone/menaquinone biosynthesis C-methylase UbiE|uniref:class I SAM-dependent methyltransferase n=1 Tax=Brevibacillus centrosporus TaxID=54910 RepID=UPI00382AAE53
MAWDSIWEEIFKQQAWGKYPGEDVIRFVARNFYRAEVRSDIKILEVGCGTGANLWYMANEGFTVYGIDGSETAIKTATARLDADVKGWKGELAVGDITNLSYPDGFFDAVIDVGAVCCNSFENAQKIYNEMARVTKKGGKMFSRTFATGSWGDGTGEKVGHNAYMVTEGPLANRGYNRFTELSEIPSLIEGYKLTEIELQTRTFEGRTKDFKEWVIIGEKVVD